IIGTYEDYQRLKDQLAEGIAGFGSTLVKDGKISITGSSDYYTQRASRTAIGITKTGKVVFMVMDGRQGEYSCGGSMEEIAQVMLDAGCVDAMNLDGGGSSTYVARLAGEEELSVVNHPSDGVSRSVSTSLFVASTAPNSKEFDHAVIDSECDYLTVNSSVQLTASGVSATNNAVDMPEGTSWMVADESYGTVTKDGLFTAKKEGDVDVKVMLEGDEVGTTTLHVVKPDNLYFTRPSINAVYGQTVAIPVTAVYKNKEVAINGNDVVFTLSDETAGKIDGLNFAIDEKAQLKNVQITAKLAGNDAVSAQFMVYLYNQGEASFDFEQATGGSRQFAWDRKISNAVTDDNRLYSVVEASDKMESSYTFAIDMSHIDMPERLEDLTYMLPGADMEGASAWTFLCQLAERMSDQTEVRATVEFDKNVDVDYSGLTLVNDYFMLTDKKFDQDTNSLIMTLKWKKQDKPIELAMANPICILSGIKTTPKAGAAWNNREQLTVVNKGSVDYTVYMRANGLYTFCQNAENREIYGLQPYTHPNIPTEKGGYFSSNYTTFEEDYILDKSIKNGWVTGEGKGLRYYDNGKMYLGIREVEGVYYDFGKTGLTDRTPYAGELTEDGAEYYIANGKKMSGWVRFGENDWRYYNEKTLKREKVTVEATPKSCLFDTRYVFTSESGAVKETKHEDAGGHEYANETTKDAVCTVCGWHRVDMEDLDLTLGFKKVAYSGKAQYPSHKLYDKLHGTYLVKNGDYFDYYWSFENNVQVGKATITLTARKPATFVDKTQWRGNYRGQKVGEYLIV
ncbi:MAG: phosphodiester glycosidase family protein, partial [Firmicutes bacterium]|nr:phosphodiester glycosidase family protein [Bacillota bacterium]